MKHEKGVGDMVRYDMSTANTLSHACVRCLYATQGMCQNNESATWSVFTRLTNVDGLSSSSHVRGTKTPFFECIGMCPWTPVMAFFTDATPAHEFGNKKNPLPSKTTCSLC